VDHPSRSRAGITEVVEDGATPDREVVEPDPVPALPAGLHRAARVHSRSADTTADTPMPIPGPAGGAFRPFDPDVSDLHPPGHISEALETRGHLLLRTRGGG